MKPEVEVPEFKSASGEGKSKSAPFQVMPLSEETPKDIGQRDMKDDFQSMLEPDEPIYRPRGPVPANKKDRAFVGKV